jgi:hypothetical protein
MGADALTDGIMGADEIFDNNTQCQPVASEFGWCLDINSFAPALQGQAIGGVAVC